MAFTSLICFPPVDQLLRRLPAADTFLRDGMLLEGHTAAGRRGIFLDSVLACLIPAPHGPYKSRPVVDGIHKFFIGMRIIRMGVSVCTGTFQHILLHGLKHFGKLRLQLIQRYDDLLSRIPGGR